MGNISKVVSLFSPSYRDHKLSLNPGRAMVAAAGLSRASYRTGFDVSLPTFSVVQEIDVDRPLLISRERKSLLALPQFHLDPSQRKILSELYSDHPTNFVRFKSCTKDGTDKRCTMEGAAGREVSRYLWSLASYLTELSSIRSYTHSSKFRFIETDVAFIGKVTATV